jgi:hypothetical protein
VTTLSVRLEELEESEEGRRSGSRTAAEQQRLTRWKSRSPAYDVCYMVTESMLFISCPMLVFI